MASWLKVAEDLFEGVDRRAKLVVNELSDEQSDSHSAASNGLKFRARREKSKEKGHPRLSNSETSKTSDKQAIIQLSSSNVAADKSEVVSSENMQGIASNSTAQSREELSQKDTIRDFLVAESPFLENPPNDVSGHDTNGTYAESVTSSVSGDGPIENTKGGDENCSSSLFKASGVESVNVDHPGDDGMKVQLAGEKESPEIKEVEPEPEGVEANATNNVQEKDVMQEPCLNKQRENKSDLSPMREQEQLEEAQGLLKIAISTGQSKEARLARVCAGLSTRLQEYKFENAQLEELLIVERERSNSYKTHIKLLEQDLSVSKTEVNKIESNMADALAAKNSEIEAIVSSMDALKKQAAASEGKFSSLQANTEAVMRSRELTETRMMQALREELASAERKAEEERAAHNATKMAAMEREVELEQRAVEASTALARIQRTADERTSRASELEQKVSLLEVECASLTQELQEMEARARRGHKRSPEEANQTHQVLAWQEEAEKARQGQRDAESKLSSLEAEVQKMRVEMAAMKRDAEHYSRQEHTELEKRYRELTDLLYHKQTQLEAMASEKAASEFQLEKEMKRFHEAQVEAERSRAWRRSSATWEDETDLKALEPLPLHHRHVPVASLQKAVKLLDSGVVRATRFLWRYPLARVILVFYLVFVHLFLMYLLHRLQEQADQFLSYREDAASMGVNSSLP